LRIFEAMESITWTCRPFKDLGNEELYEILRLRIEVFVIEQNCPYQDADGKDLKSWHLQGRQHGKLIAYTRLVPPGISYEEPSIGRVITSKEARGTGAGKMLMIKSIEYLKKEFGNVPIRIGAQAYLQQFYEGFGFVKEGDGYLEDGIPHFIMLRKP
jgi:ElaA protein